MQLVFATNNLNKLKEVQALIPTQIKLLSLNEINCTEDIPETQNTKRTLQMKSFIGWLAKQVGWYVFEKLAEKNFPHLDKEVWRARELAKREESRHGHLGGEYRRHQVYAKLIKEFPHTAKRDLGLSVELAVQDKPWQ